MPAGEAEGEDKDAGEEGEDGHVVEHEAEEAVDVAHGEPLYFWAG